MDLKLPLLFLSRAFFLQLKVIMVTAEPSVSGKPGDFSGKGGTVHGKIFCHFCPRIGNVKGRGTVMEELPRKEAADLGGR